MKRKSILTTVFLFMVFIIACGGGGGDESTSADSRNPSEVDRAAIEARVTALSAIRNNALTTPGSVGYADAAAFFSDSFGIDSGYTRDEKIYIMLDQTGRVATISSTSDFTYRDKSNGIYYVQYILNLSDGSRIKEGRYFIKEGSEWKLIGNGRHSYISAYPKCILGINYDGSILMLSGLYFEFRDHGNYGLQTVIATGPGLPPGGLTFTKSPTDNVFYLDSDYWYNTPFRINTYGFYVIDDGDVIGAIPDNAQYTIRFFKSGEAIPAETVIITNPKRPYKISELTSDYFPSTTLTSHKFSAINFGGDNTIPYIKPTMGESDRIYMIGDALDSTFVKKNPIWTDLPFDKTSYTVHIASPSFTPYWGYLLIRSQDLNNRMAELQWIYFGW